MIRLQKRKLRDSNIEDVVHLMKKIIKVWCIDLSFNELGGGFGLRALFDVKGSLRFLKVIILANNNLNDDDVEPLCQYIKDTRTLTEVNLEGNNISKLGANMISKALGLNNSVRLLNLRWNKIGDTGCKYISCLLANEISEITHIAYIINIYSI
jgi:Ran GTPase-activating protein (RanGAP) involved in mRNA processing and transport